MRTYVSRRIIPRLPRAGASAEGPEDLQELARAAVPGVEGEGLFDRLARRGVVVLHEVVERFGRQRLDLGQHVRAAPLVPEGGAAGPELLGRALADLERARVRGIGREHVLGHPERLLGPAFGEVPAGGDEEVLRVAARRLLVEVDLELEIAGAPGRQPLD